MATKKKPYRAHLHYRAPVGAPEYADSVDRQRLIAYAALREATFARAFPTERKRQAYLDALQAYLASRNAEAAV